MPKVQNFPRRSKSSRADLVFPVSRVHRKLKIGRYAEKIGVGGAVYLASVLEYLVAELLELAGNCCVQHKRKQLTPRHIFLAIHNDEELSQLLDGVWISNGGVMPEIQAVLLQKRSRSKRRSK